MAFKLPLLLAGLLALSQLSVAQKATRKNVVCKSGKYNAKITLSPGASYTFSTSGSNYAPNQRCTAQYKIGKCKKASVSCSKFSTVANTKCAGDFLMVRVGKKKNKFCNKKGPNMSITSNFALQFISNKVKSGSGVVCTVKCDDSTSGTTTQKPGTTVGVFKCPPDTAGLYADPNSCSNFFNCLFGTEFVLTCPPGTLWNDKMKYCDWPKNVNCNITPTTASPPTPKPTTAKPTAAPTTQKPVTTTKKPATTTSQKPVTTTSSTSSGNCEDFVSISSTWTGNMGGTLKVPVKNSLTTYTLTVTTNIPFKLFQLWDANVDPSSGNKFTITPKSWFSGAVKDTVLSLGFQASFNGGEQPVFTSMIFNDGTAEYNLCNSGSNPTAGPTTAAPTAGPTTAAPTAGPSTAAPTGGPTTTPCSSKRIVCYYPNWAYYRQGLGKYFVNNIDPTLCTHFLYSFAVLDETSLTMKVYDTWVDLDLKGFQEFVALKKQYPKKKFIIALGGWNDSRTNKYSNLLKDPAKRANFVEKAIQFIQQYGFDGLDLDYEYPAYQQSASEKETFAAWCRELKTAFQPYGWELTAAVAAGKDKIDAGYDVPEISKYLDAIHLMTYDLHGSWESTVNHHAPMTSSDPNDYLTVTYAVDYWLSKGAPKEKLVVGIPTYGRTFTLRDSSQTGIGAPASGAGTAGQISRQSGFLGYQEVCLLIAEGGWTVNRDGPLYTYKGTQWIGYDDAQEARKKAQYILENDLGGAMFWDLPSDDFNNRCGQGNYPIIGAVYDEMQGSCK